jgi:two-component system, OmpR family, response regulator
MRILVVDDDSSMALLARRLLEEEGYGVDVAVDGESARLLAMVNEYDAIVLDLMLPDGNSIPLIQQLRREGRHTPITVLTGTTDKAVTVRALDAGADDYLTKPIEFGEFKARMRALVRRGGATRTEQVTVGNVTLNRLTREVVVHGAPVRITPRELGLLEHLLLHGGELVTRTELLEKVFDLTFDPGTNVVDVTVGRLRRKLRNAGATIHIEARRGLGFVLSPAMAP